MSNIRGNVKVTIRGCLCATGGVALLATAGVARATDIAVNTNAMTTSATDGKCTLVEAVNAVNTQTRSGAVTGECAAGNGVGDKITLPSSAQTYSTNSTLTIYRQVEIAGAGEAASKLSTGALYGITVDDRLHIGTHAYIHNLTIQNSRSDGLPVFCAVVESDDLGSPTLNMDNVTITKCTNGLIARGNGDESFFGRYVTIKANQSTGIEMNDSNVNFEYSLISGNTGGGIYSTTTGNSNLILDHTTVDGNSSGGNGGGIYLDGAIGGIANIIDSTISNNTASGDGGGIYDLGHLTVRTSTVSGNKATRGGGLYHESFGECYFYDSTLAFNTATSKGGGIYSMFGTNAMMQTSIVAKNTAPTGPDCNGPLNGSIVPVGGANSLLGNSAGCPTSPGAFTIQNQDPKLGALMSPGAFGATKVHPLLKGSPAIDSAGAGSGGDQRFMWRPNPVVGASGFVQPGTAADMGAFEYSTIWPYSTLPVVATSGDPLDSTGQLVTYAANATGDYITFSPLIAEPGTYAVTAQVQKWRQGGIYQLQASDTLGGTYSNFSSQDLYASATSTPALAFGSVTFSSAGLKYLRFKVTGKNNSSTGYKFYLGYLKLVKA